MAQFPTPFGGKSFVMYPELFVYAKILHKCVVFQICSVWKCLWKCICLRLSIINCYQVINYQTCDVFADP